MKVKVETWEVFTPELETGKLKVAVALQRNSKKKILRAPLAIFIPGTFGNLNGTMANRWMDSLTRLGYHVISFPNPFGTDFVSQVPMGKFGTVTTEAKSLYGVVREIYKKLRMFHALNGSVRLIGISLGGFFSSILAALDAEHPNPILTTDATIISPPFHLGRGIDRLDGLVDELRDPYQEMSLLRTFFKFRKLCRLESSSEANVETLRDARGLVSFHGFYKGLMSSVKKYDKVRSLSYIPKKKSAYQRWRNRFKFSTYYDDLNPEGKRIIRSVKGHLYYWMAKAYRAGFPSIRVLTTTDDFFNDPGAWNSLDLHPMRDGMNGMYGLILDPEMWARIRQNLIVLEHGGHYGFRGKPWFEKFIRLSFGWNEELTRRQANFEELYPEPALELPVVDTEINPFQ